MSFADATAAMEWGECWLEPAPVPDAVAAEVRRLQGGILPAWAQRLSAVPWVVLGFARLGQKRVAHMPLELWDLIALVVSQDNSCRYCYGATRTILKTLGYDDALIDRLERDVHLTELSPATRTALQFARKVSQANPRPTAGDLEALARAGFSRPAIVEIAGTAACMGFHNRISTAFALPPEPFERWLQHPLMRLVRPLVARGFRGKKVASAPAPAAVGPCADVVAALDGAPIATTLRQTIDEAIASPVLPQRTKLLMLAVVGRALGCDHAEAEARGGLGADGLTSADVDQILANLGSPKLDAREALLLPFARDSVRYRNLALQERTRELGQRLSRAEVIEAVGIAALANGVARASVLLEMC
jgi:alkylhydroperoxidase family enzyme